MIQLNMFARSSLCLVQNGCLVIWVHIFPNVGLTVLYREYTTIRLIRRRAGHDCGRMVAGSLHGSQITSLPRRTLYIHCYRSKESNADQYQFTLHHWNGLTILSVEVSRFLPQFIILSEKLDHNE